MRRVTHVSLVENELLRLAGKTARLAEKPKFTPFETFVMCSEMQNVCFVLISCKMEAAHAQYELLPVGVFGCDVRPDRVRGAWCVCANKAGPNSLYARISNSSICKT
jgi:hypothetical protein